MIKLSADDSKRFIELQEAREQLVLKRKALQSNLKFNESEIGRVDDESRKIVLAAMEEKREMVASESA